MFKLPPICIPLTQPQYNRLISSLVEQAFGPGEPSFFHAAQTLVGKVHEFSWLHPMQDGSKVVYSYISEADAATLILLLLTAAKNFDCEIEDYCELLESKGYR